MSVVITEPEVYIGTDKVYHFKLKKWFCLLKALIKLNGDGLLLIVLEVSISFCHSIKSIVNFALTPAKNL